MRCAYSKGLTIACYFTELWPFYLLSYGVGQGAVLGVFIIFSDSSSFYFCHNVLKIHLLQMHQNMSASGKGLISN